MSKLNIVTELISTLSLVERDDGFWLYDRTRGMNLSMRAKTPQDAFVEALRYYQYRLTEVETQYATLKKSVDKFVEQHCEGHNDDSDH